MATEGPSTAGSLPEGPPHAAPLLSGPDYVPVGHDLTLGDRDDQRPGAQASHRPGLAGAFRLQQG